MNRKSFIRGTLILAAAGIIAKILGFFFRIPLIYMIGEEGIGLYQLTYPLYTFLLALAAGIPTAISKMISERMALNKIKEAHNIFQVAFFVMLVFGILSTLSLIVFSKSIINAFKWGDDAYYSLIGISLAPLFTCLLSAYRGYFQGLQEMAAPAASQIIEQIIRVCIGVGLAYLLLPHGIPIAAGGAAFGAAAGAAVGLLWMIYNYSKRRIVYSKFEKSRTQIRLFNEILAIAVPVSLGQAIGSIMALVDSMIVLRLLKSSGYSQYTATVLYGQLTGKAHVLINVPLTLSIALAMSIVPAVAESFALNDISRLNRNIKTAFKFVMILALPSCAGLYVLARPILSLIFQGMGDGWQLMQILAIASVFIIIAQTATSILNGIGKTIMPVIAIIFGTAVKIIINMIFIPIPRFNIKAAAYSTLFAYILIAAIDIVFVIKHTKVYINIKEIFVLPAVCTLVMIALIMIIFNNTYHIANSYNIATLVSIVSGAASYFIMLLLTKTLTLGELRGYLKK